MLAAMEEFDGATRVVANSTIELCALGWSLEQVREAFSTAMARPGSSVDPIDLDVQATILEWEFWDRVEIVTLRLCGAWDRAAQLLSCVFFNVREFDRDTFPSVIDRLRVNFARGDAVFEQHVAWQALQRYADDTSVDGYRDLVSRRNVMAHSIGLDRSGNRPRETIASERPNNPLDAKRLTRLRQGKSEDEARRVISQLQRLLALRISVIDLCHFGVDTYRLRPARF